jgi:hypothetical protein
LTTRSQTLAAARTISSNDEFVAALRARHPEALAQLDRIMSGDVHRNDSAILQAIKLQFSFAEPAPKQVIEHQGSVGISVIDPYAEGPEQLAGPVVEALPAAAPVVALPPRRRRPAVVPATPPSGGGTP